MKQNKRQFTGVWIPKALYLSKELGWTAKLLLLEIYGLSGSDGCYANNEHFAEHLQVTPGRLKNILTGLEKDGYIRREVKGKTRHIFLDAKGHEIVTEGHEIVTEGHEKVTPIKVFKETIKEPPKAPQKDAGLIDDKFDMFWLVYPRKTAKPVAKKSFIKKCFPKGEFKEDVFKKIMLDIPARKKHDEQWVKDNGAYIPHPATYLNQERYNDEWLLLDDASSDVTIPKEKRERLYKDYKLNKRSKKSEVNNEPDDRRTKH